MNNLAARGEKITAIVEGVLKNLEVAKNSEGRRRKSEELLRKIP